MKDKLRFRIRSLLRIKLDLIEHPELSSKINWVQKGIKILKTYAPQILKYLSKQEVLSNLNKYRIEFIINHEIEEEKMRHVFRIWIGKERFKRLIMIIIEALLIPFTGILAILPGPNFFFYIPALLFYYHFKSYQGLKKVDTNTLEMEIVINPEM